MLALESERWGSLQQAYGTAEDVPRLISALAATLDEAACAELWFALWRMLWRPDGTWDAAYAAVPQLMTLTASRPMPERLQAIHLALRVELLRRGPTAPPMPADLLPAYAAAIDGLPDAVHALAREPWSAEVAQLMAAALLVGKRNADLAAAVLALGDN